MKAAYLLLLSIPLLIGCTAQITGCTMEMMSCPNGRGVGRVGPDCEFAPCELPASQNECQTKSGFWKDWCYKDYASQVTVDVTACHEIMRENVKNECYYAIAARAQSIQVCHSLPKFKEECVLQVAKTSTDDKICIDLKEQKKAECFSTIGSNSNNKLLCDKAKGYVMGDYDLQYLCLRNIAQKNGDAKFCNSLDNYGYEEPYYARDCNAAFQ